MSLEEPLKGPVYRFQRDWEKPKTFRGPKRAIRLFLLGVTIPLLFIAIPLYLKYVLCVWLDKSKPEFIKKNCNN